MKAVGYQQSLPIENPSALLDIELPVPVAAHRDLLVEVRAISVNPVDVNATNLRKAHALIESGRSRGKIVLAGF